jgi:hypothetical protein
MHEASRYVTMSFNTASGADVSSDSVLPTGSRIPLRLTRRFNVSIEGTLHNYESAGSMAATWKPLANTHTHMFGPDMTMHDTTDQAAVMNSIGNAVIVKATMLESQSTFPVPLGISCNVIPGCEMNEFGDRYLCTVLPKSRMAEAQCLYEADPQAQNGLEWRVLYPDYNKSNLDTEGVMEVKNCPYVFVSQGHPAISLLKANEDMVNQKFDETDLIDNEWYKITRQVFSKCCETLRSQILAKLHTADLNNFTMQLHRFNNVMWTTIDNEEHLYGHGLSEQAKETEYEHAMKHPYSYQARIELQYELNH